MNAVGRPTLYKPEYCELLIEHMGSGLSFEAFAGVVGVCKKTLYDWEKANPEFLHAKSEGLEKARLFWEKLGVNNIINESFGKDGSRSLNSTVWIFNMKNRFGWRDKQPDEAPDTVVNNNTLQVSQEQLNEMLKIARGDK